MKFRFFLHSISVQLVPDDFIVSFSQSYTHIYMIYISYIYIDGGRNWLMAYAPTGAKGIYIYSYLVY